MPLDGSPRITRREAEILALLAEGRTYQEIAQQLGIKLGTTRAHLATLRLKLSARNRTEVVVWWLSRSSDQANKPTGDAAPESR